MVHRLHTLQRVGSCMDVTVPVLREQISRTAHHHCSMSTQHRRTAHSSSFLPSHLHSLSLTQRHRLLTPAHAESRLLLARSLVFIAPDKAAIRSPPSSSDSTPTMSNSSLSSPRPLPGPTTPRAAAQPRRASSASSLASTPRDGSGPERVDACGTDLICYDQQCQRRSCPNPSEHRIENGTCHPTLDPSTFSVWDGRMGIAASTITKNGHHQWQINGDLDCEVDTTGLPSPGFISPFSDEASTRDRETDRLAKVATTEGDNSYACGRQPAGSGTGSRQAGIYT